ncbi:4-aminobutyrate--2-oxoglutarate transaminase [Halothiobacillus neapolitanus]|uniref:4-aminobutyrate aminotransferase n=1 Tax=Halothiobacillus neapolitanus (strain ATCC 23641 / DSM 15147 / CIP 104769 / NCIMB 8539 / c2) TaxID=555778 RepID=D0KX60_HALNC|nr:4-aminobutyrate--2-oxoglutarate transaminase [Halothiobacillus neapolitanus]ACX97180.1 4-aminobutyrate aminotransferase [Halothiobacillus neapolitanus c2]TDN60316.1 4-aminobutyrate aminotransferase [Halothiobacillus neapolitanus]
MTAHAMTKSAQTTAPNDQSMNADLQARRLAATPRGVGVMAGFYIDRAQNAEVWDVEGNRYIDFAGGIAVLNTGHRHPALVAAIEEQLKRFTHTCYQVLPYESYVRLAERINALVPGHYAKKTAFFSSGAEAVENAVKIARSSTGRPGIIAFSGGFHGRTMMGCALTGKVVPYKVGFGPFPSEVYHLPFPMELHGVTVEDSLHALETLFKAEIEPSRVAAIIIEPVQGEGGFYVAPPQLLHGLRKVCDEHGILLIFDEVQTGFGRTGKLFATEYYDVLPDIVTMAKSMAGGMTLSAVCGRAEVMDAPAPGGLGGTYAGNPLAIAAALAVIDVMEKEQLVERSNFLGEKLMARLNAAQAAVPALKEVRGLGSMVAAEFCDPATGAPSPDAVKRVQQAALEEGLILLTCGVYANVIRFLYPLTTEDTVFDEALDILDRALAKA